MNIGIVGIGNWGSRVFPEYKKLEAEGIIDNAYSCDVKEKADYKNYLDMMDAVDGVHICLPNKYHFDVTKDILCQGKHVLVEKPMTLSKAEAHKLIEIASDQGVILQVGYILRFANVLRKLREMMNQKYLGDIYYATLQWTAFAPPMHGADIIWDLLPHPLDIMHFLTGKFPDADGTQVMERHFRRKELGEVALLNLDYGDFVASVELSWLTPIKRRLLYLYGSKRSVRVECVDQKLQVFDTLGSKTITVEKNDTIRDEALNFIECLKNGKNRFNSHIIGLQNTEVIENIMRQK